jgi:hypothetical protein
MTRALRARKRSTVALSLLLLFLFVCSRFSIAGPGLNDVVRDPIPIQRVEVTPEKLAEELKQHPHGIYVELPRKAFDEKIRAAAQAQQDALTPPRIVEAHYRAFFEPDGLRGTVQWRVVHSTQSPGVLSLETFNVAIGHARIDNANAIIGDLDGKSAGLLVEKPGEHVVTMDWASRVEVRPGGYQAEIETPRTPICDLDIYLPRDLEFCEPADGCLLSGPHPSDQPDSFLWRMTFPQVSPLHLMVRRTDAAAAPQPLVKAQLRSTVALQPDGLEADFEFDVRVLHRGLRRLLVAVSSDLDVASVRIPGLEQYAILPPGPMVGPPAPGAPQLVEIRLRDDFRTGKLLLHCRAPLRFSSAGRLESWTAPTAMVIGGVQGETLTVRVSADISLDNWQSGHFRLVGVQAMDDGGRRFVLEGGALDASPAGWIGLGNRPSSRLIRAAVDYMVRQQTWWQIQHQTATLTSRLTIEVSRGRLHQIPLQLPPEWEVEQVESVAGDDLVSWWRVVPENNVSMLYVMLKRLLVAPGSVSSQGNGSFASTGQFTVRLRPTPRKGTEPIVAPGLPMRLPDLVPVKARWREGGLGIGYDRTVLEASLNTVPVYRGGSGLLEIPSESECPWGNQPPQDYLPFRGEPHRGTLTVVFLGQRLRAACSTAVFLDSAVRKIVVQARMSLRVDTGNVHTVQILMPGAAGPGWEVRDWKSEDAHTPLPKIERVPGQSDCWRLSFAQPLSAVRPVNLTCEVIGDLPADSCDVPLPVVGDAASVEGDVKIFLAGVNVGNVEHEGLQEQSGVSSPRGGPAAWRSFRYSAVPVRLTLAGLMSAADRSAEAGADNVSLTTTLDLSGQLRHQYRFDVWIRRLRAIPLGVTIPENATLRAVCVDGQWLTDATALTMKGRQLSLPMPALSAARTEDVQGSGGADATVLRDGLSLHTYELVYTTDSDRFNVWGTLQAPVPELSVQVSHCRHKWCLPPDFLPLHPDWLDRLPSNDSDGGATRWAELASADGSSIVVVRSRGVPLAGVALALLLSLAFLFMTWKLSEIPQRAPLSTSALFALLMAWLALSGLASVWLPSSLNGLARAPFAAAIVIGLIWYLQPMFFRRRSRSTTTLVGSPVSAGLVLLAGALMLWSVMSVNGEEKGSGVSQTPLTVYLLKENSSSGLGQRVLAPQELLTQLENMARALPAGLEGAVLVSAEHSGEVRDDRAFFKSIFKAQCFRDDERAVTLTIPLAGVQITDDDVLLDGARTAPTAVGRPPTAWQFLVRGRGIHTVEIPFSIPVRRDGIEADLEFQIPPLLQSRLTFAAPAGSYYLAARGTTAPARGPQRAEFFGTEAYVGRLLAAATGSSLPLLASMPFHPTQPVKLHAELGRLTSPLRIRWQELGDQPQRSNIQLSEAYLWNIHPSSVTLTGLLRYEVREGTLGSVSFDLPPGIEVEAIEGSLLPEHIPLRLRSWQVAEVDNRRQLQVSFVRPVRGDIELELHLLTASAAGAALDLVVPSPVMPMDYTKSEHLLAYQLEHMEVRGLELHQAARTEPGRFRHFRGAISGAGASEPRDVFSFRRRPGDFTLGRLQLAPSLGEPSAVQDVHWQVSADFADFKARCQLTAGEDGIALVEWELPAGLQITRVTGNDVLSWSRTGTRLQVTLGKSTGEPAARGDMVVTVIGWQKHEITHGVQFAVPAIRLLGVRNQRNLLHVVPGAGLTLERAGASGPGPALLQRGVRAEWEQAYQQTAPRATYFVRRSADVKVALLSTLEQVGSRLQWTATVDCQSLHGDLRSLNVHLQGWSGDVRLDAPRPAAMLAEPVKPQIRTWHLAFLPGTAASYRFSVSGSVTLDEFKGAQLKVPLLSVDEADSEQSSVWLATSTFLSVSEQRGIAGAVQGEVESAWPSEKPRLQTGKLSFWKVTDKEWNLSFTPPAIAIARKSLHVVLIEHSAAVVDGAHWRHDATYWIRHGNQSDIGFRLPDGTRLLALAVDGHDATVLQPAADRLWIPLSGGTGASRVDVRWELADESLAQPNLGGPVLEEAEQGPTIWSVFPPAGFYAAGVGDTTGTSGTAGVQAVRAADANEMHARLLQEFAQLPIEAQYSGSQIATAPLVAPQSPRQPLFWRADFVGSIPEVRFVPVSRRQLRVSVLLSLLLIVSLASVVLCRRWLLGPRRSQR